MVVSSGGLLVATSPMYSNRKPNIFWDKHRENILGFALILQRDNIPIKPFNMANEKPFSTDISVNSYQPAQHPTFIRQPLSWKGQRCNICAYFKKTYWYPSLSQCLKVVVFLLWTRNVLFSFGHTSPASLPNCWRDRIATYSINTNWICCKHVQRKLLKLNHYLYIPNVLIRKCSVWNRA